MVTLTYSEEELPDDGSLDVREWQLFAKRLRKQKGPFRFFHCGEYGELNGRPHYHSILFGHDFRGDRRPWRNAGGRNQIDVSEELENLWGKGFCSVSDLTFESAAYVARYIMKKATGDRALQRYRRVDEGLGCEWLVEPEYCTMSRRPGLGDAWFEKFGHEVYPDDFVVHDGRKFRPPSFYDRRLPDEVLEEVKASRRTKASKHKAEQTADRLATKEKCLDARLGLLRREV